MEFEPPLHQGRVSFPLRDFFSVVILGAFSILVIFVLIFGNRLTDLRVPLMFSATSPLGEGTPGGEGLWRSDPEGQNMRYNQVDLYQVLSSIVNLQEDKTFSSDRIDIPTGFESKSIPTSNFYIGLGVTRLLMMVTDSPGLISNLLLLVSISTVFLTTLVLMMLVKVGKTISLLGSLAIALHPSVFGREPFLSGYYHGLILSIGIIFLSFVRKRVSLLLFFIAGAVSALSGLYASVFSIILVGSALVFIDPENVGIKQRIMVFGAFTVPIVTAGAISLAPTYLYWRRTGVVTVSRGQSITEKWPSRLTDAFSIPDFSILADVFSRQTFVKANLGEGFYTYGPYGALAFALALFVALSPVHDHPSSRAITTLKPLASFLIFLHFVPVTGGINSLMSALLPAVIKSWERFQLPLAILSIFFIGIWAGEKGHFDGRLTRRLRPLIAVGALSVGLILSLPFGAFGDSHGARSRWYSDSDFYSRIESRGLNQRVLVLPVMGGFEGPPWGVIPPYSDLIGSIHTSSTRFSAGLATRDLKLNDTVDFSMDGPAINVLRKLNANGFDALVVDNRESSKSFLRSLSTSPFCNPYFVSQNKQFSYCSVVSPQESLSD